jgi:mRNA-degrading endonuclease RelE of RelBE toxin-antitoxin system
MGDIEGVWLEELCRIAPVSPQGQKRILAIVQPVVYRLRVGSFRGATWVDEGNGIVWLCAVRRREQDSDDDPYA